MKSLVIVESPTKAKTISRFLNSNYIVKASMGHIRDLPSNATEIPLKYKKEKWASLGIDVDNNFKPLYVIPETKKKVVAELQKLIKGADELILATDEDREGESISWHLKEVLKPKISVKRMVFHEITSEAIAEALKNFRKVDMQMVDAQETRRLLDRLVGYTLSPLLWRKIAFGLSAGRVQSVAVKLVVERELERRKFKIAKYFDLTALLSKHNFKKQNNLNSKNFEAGLISFKDQKIADGSDFDETTGELKKGCPNLLLDKKTCNLLVEKLKKEDFIINKIEKSSQKRSPSAPFITSTLQQEAINKLGFTAKRTMQVAQKLYEKGYITYMRTDSIILSDQAIKACREYINQNFKDLLLEKLRFYKNKSKNAQEAHEAIRPAGKIFKTASDLHLTGDESKLYEMIFSRTIASQMVDAEFDITTIFIKAGDAMFRTSQKRVSVIGFLAAYSKSKSEYENLLPFLEESEKLDLEDLKTLEHETKPPARYTEASLVKKLEYEGIGRPSTYATIISTVQSRGYIFKIGYQLVPTFTAFAVGNLLEKYFSTLVDLKFTAKMEEDLDEIAKGKKESLPYLKKFFSSKDGLANKVARSVKNIDARTMCTLNFPDLSFSIRIGKYGAFVEKGNRKNIIRFALPNIAPADVTDEQLNEIYQAKLKGSKPIGKDPETLKNVYILTGKYGQYVQLGENEDKDIKRTSIPKFIPSSALNFDLAIKLLALPKVLGVDKEGYEIKMGIGRFGPYVVANDNYASLPKEMSFIDTDLIYAKKCLLIKSKRDKKLLNNRTRS